MDLIQKWLSGKRNYYVGAVLYKQFGRDEKLKALFSGQPTPRLQQRLEEELSVIRSLPTPDPSAPSLAEQIAKVHQLEEEVKNLSWEKQAQEEKLEGLEDEVRSLSWDTMAQEEKLEELKEAVSDLDKMKEAIKKLEEAKDNGAEMPESQDPVLKALRLEWLVPYQRMNYLRHELDRYESASEEDIARRKAIVEEILQLEQSCMRIWERREAYLKDGKLPEVKTGELEIPADPVALGKLIESTKRNIRRNKQLAEKHPDNPAYPLKARHYEEQLQQILRKSNPDEGQATN